MSETLFPIPEPEADAKLEPAGVKGKPRSGAAEPGPDGAASRGSGESSGRRITRRERVWEFVESLDLSPLYAKVQSVEGVAGRPAIDPRIYLALWLYATIEGVGSARALERLTRPTRCVSVDLGRGVGQPPLVVGLSGSAWGVSRWGVDAQRRGVDGARLVKLNRVSQDGIRVRASAGAASFRRQASLERCLQEAEEQVERLRQELEEDPEATSRRQAAARQRAVEDRRRRVEAALAQMPDVAAKKPAAEKDKARVSTTDAEARVMKMGDGGFRPAYNGQFAVDTETQIVVGVELSNSGSDQGQLVPMIEQLQKRYGGIPSESLVDGGFAGLKDIEKASELGTQIYAPVAKPKDKTRDPYVPLGDRLPCDRAVAPAHGHAGGQGDLQAAGATVECVNALARNRGLQRLLVRGQHKARAMLLVVRHRPQCDAQPLAGRRARHSCMTTPL